jgi:hypothetical protein
MTKPQSQDRDLEGDCRELLVEVGDGGTFLKVRIKSDDHAMLGCKWISHIAVIKISDGY